MTTIHFTSVCDIHPTEYAYKHFNIPISSTPNTLHLELSLALSVHLAL